MAPETHLLTSWLIAAKTTGTPRDCRLVTLAGILPDLDGLGLLVDLAGRALGFRTQYYASYHHVLLHGMFGAILLALAMAALADQKWRVAVLTLLVCHLHLLFDFLASRGPAPEDLWPIFYFGPFDKDLMWIWKGQWRLDGWQNRIFGVACLAAALWLPLKLGHSVVGVFNRRADAVFVAILRKWHLNLRAGRNSALPPQG